MPRERDRRARSPPERRGDDEAPEATTTGNIPCPTVLRLEREKERKASDPKGAQLGRGHFGGFVTLRSHHGGRTPSYHRRGPGAEEVGRGPNTRQGSQRSSTVQMNPSSVFSLTPPSRVQEIPHINSCHQVRVMSFLVSWCSSEVLEFHVPTAGGRVHQCCSVQVLDAFWIRPPTSWIPAGPGPKNTPRWTWNGVSAQRIPTRRKTPHDGLSDRKKNKAADLYNEKKKNRRLLGSCHTIRLIQSSCSQIL